MKPVIREAIILLFSSLSFGKFGNIKDISFVKMLCAVQLLEKFIPYKNQQMGQVS